MSQGIDPDKVEKSLYDVLVDHIPIREIIHKREIDIAVASIDLAGAEIAMSTKIGRERSLEKALKEVSDDYDFVCIDTPPSLGLLTINALTAADKVIVPVQCEYLSMRGLVQLQNTLKMIHENLNPRVQIEGILPTMLDSRTVHAKEAVEILEENFGELVFKSRIRKAIKFAEAPVRGLERAQVRSEGQRRQLLPGAGEGGPDEWLGVSGPACARVRSPTSSAPPPTTDAGSRAADDEPEPARRPGAPRARRPRARRAADDRVATAAARPPRPDPERVRAYRVEEREPLIRDRSQGAPQPDLRRRGPRRREPDLRPGRARAPATTTGRRGPHLPVIRVVGVGGAGVNAINRMVEAQIPGVEFMAVNTDLQSLQQSTADVTVHLGSGVARGLGTGSNPELGYRAAFEEQDKIKRLLKGSDMVFVAAGAGGGTGTGAAPVVARLARDVGALTVGIVTKPFSFEGTRRAKQADKGIEELSAEVDTLIVVPNERLLSVLARRPRRWSRPSRSPTTSCARACRGSPT